MKNTHFKFLIVSLLMAFSLTIQAKEKALTYLDQSQWDALTYTEKELPNGDSLSLKVIGEKSHRLYLWIGQAIPPNDGDALLLKQLSQTGQIWFLNTPEALFTENDRTAMRNMSGTFLPPLVNQAISESEEVIIITSDVGAVPTLRGLQLWQQQTTDKKQLNRLQAVLLFFPSLYVNTPEAGHARELFPIAFHTALPITLIQPEQGAQTNFIHETVQALKQGGSLVQQVNVPNMLDDNYRYKDIRKMADKTAQLFTAAVDDFLTYKRQLNYQIYPAFKVTTLEEPPESRIIRGLIKQEPPLKMPDNIVLEDIQNRKIDVLKEYQGKALLINFWATWCPHCVEEIPSMNNALKQLDDDKFAMVSISYRDPQKELQEFTKQFNVDFPILMDLDGKESAKWKVFAFPSTFLVDRHGKVHYTINAGTIWDTPEMIQILRELSEK